MNDGDILLRSILRDPADDAPRLAYADWLDEQGRDIQARYVRMAFDLHRRPNGNYGGELRMALGGLEVKFGPEWFAYPIRTAHQVRAARGRAPGGGCCNRYADQMACDCLDAAATYRFDRGFPAAVSCRLDKFVVFAKSLFKRLPLVAVEVNDRAPFATIAGDFGWSCDQGHMGRSWWLPDCLWDLLGPEGGRRGYPTADAARAALSASCVAWGRHLNALDAA